METNNKLREALKLCIDEMCNRCREQAAARGDAMPCLSGCEPVRKAKAALAEPVRNCDRFGGDCKLLNAAWFDWTGSPSGQNADGTVKLTFAEWLLAPATGKEGGAKKPCGPNAVKTGDMLLAENERLRRALSDIAENLRIHMLPPTQTISMNRREVECMVNYCEKALGEEEGAE